MGNVTLNKLGTNVYLVGMARTATVWVEHGTSAGAWVVRVRSRTLTLAQRMTLIEKARQVLIQRNGGLEPKTFTDVLQLCGA